MSMKRREFLKISGAAAGAAAVVGGVGTGLLGGGRRRLQVASTDGDTVVPSFCELCFWKCGVLAHVKNGEVTKIEGNPHHPLSRGRLCPRGVGATGLLYDPDRLKRPLQRIEERGSQRFREISWDAALDEIAERLLDVKRRHGPEALALFSHGFGGSWFKHLVKAYGTDNIGAPSYAQCRGPREAGYFLTFGQSLGSPEPVDMRNSRCITLIGSHLGENMHNTQVQDFAEALGKGAELVVVDPRFSTAAGKARYWLPIKPGSDIALLLAWMNVIIEERRYDIEYIERHASGFEQLAEHVKDKTPEWAYAATGIEPEKIRETARFISSFRPASLIHPGRRATWYGNDSQRARAMAILAALLGSWGRRGGYIAHSSMELPPYPHPAYPEHREPADKPRGTSYPIAHEHLAQGLRQASMPGTADYDIKAWLVYGTNLSQSLPNQEETQRAIQELDLIVTIDVLPVEITGWSDFVLPEATYLERTDDLWAASFREPFVAARNQAVEPMYESKPGWWIARELGHRLGLEAWFPWRDVDEYLETRVRRAGYDIRELREKGVVLGDVTPVSEEEGLELQIQTQSGKIELYSETLAAMGQDPLPQHVPPAEPPPGQFRLLTGRSPLHTFGRTTNNRVLGEIVSENEVWINAQAATTLAGFENAPLRTGDRVVLVNQDGVESTPVKAKVTQRIRGDCVYLVHGFGHRAPRLGLAHGRGASDSDLTTRYETDPIMGGTAMSVNFVRVQRAGRVS